MSVPDYWFSPCGTTPEKERSLLNVEIQHKPMQTYVNSGPVPKHIKFPELLPTLKEFIETGGLSAQERRRLDIAYCGKTLESIATHLKENIGGLAEDGCSRNTVHRLFVPPNKGRKSRHMYKQLLDVKKIHKRNNLRNQDDSAQFYSSRVKLLRQLMAHFFGHTLELSCDNKNKILVGALAVSRHVEPAGFAFIDDMEEGVPDHDFPNANYKLVPMGQMVMEPRPIPQVLPTDECNRPYYPMPQQGASYVVLRSQAFSQSTVEPHINDLLEILPSILNGRTVLNIIVDNGPDWNSNSTLNQIFFARLFKSLNLDAMFIVSFCPGHSAYNMIEHLWSPCTRALAGCKIKDTIDGEHVPVPKQSGLSKEERRQKDAIVMTEAMECVCSVFNKVRYGGLDKEGNSQFVKATYQPCFKPNAPFNDHADVKEALESAKQLMQSALFEEAQFLPSHYAKRKDMLIFKKCTDATCAHCSDKPIKATALLDFLRLHPTFPNPEPDPNNPGHFKTFLQVFSEPPSTVPLDMHSKRQTDLSTKLTRMKCKIRCDICPMVMFNSKANCDFHYKVYHPQK